MVCDVCDRRPQRPDLQSTREVAFVFERLRPVSSRPPDNKPHRDHTHTRHGERHPPPRLKLVFCCRARADVFGRLGHDALQPAVERQPALPPEPARLVELGEIWGDMGRYGEIWEIWEIWGDIGDMGRYGLASLVELGLLGERVVA